jgi:hypothetical protein
MTTDEFLKKYDDDNLTDEDLEAIHYEKDFVDTDKSYWEITENAKYYKIFKVVNNIEARYFIKTYGEYGKIFELKQIAI